MYEQKNAIQTSQPGMTPYAPPPGGMMTGGDSLFRIILRSWWLVLICSLLGAGGAYLYKESVEETYMSVSRLFLNVPSISKEGSVWGYRPGSLETEVSVITSRGILNKALEDPNVRVASGLDGPERMVEVLETLSARIVKGTDIMAVSASATEPNDAANVVNAVVDAYREWHRGIAKRTAAEWLAYLTDQLNDRRQELNDAWGEREKIEKRLRDKIATSKGAVTAEEFETLQQQLIEARSVAQDCNDYYDGIMRYQGEPNNLRYFVYRHRASTASQEEAVERRNIEQRLLAERVRLNEMLTAQVVKRSELSRQRNRVARLEEELGAFDSTFLERHRSEAEAALERARARVARLEATVDGMEPPAATASEGFDKEDASYVRIVEECNLLQGLCNSLLETMKGIDVDAPRDGITIHVLERAVPATKPYSPDEARIMGIGLAIGVMLGTGLAFVRDWADKSVRSADEITAILGVPVLGAIPKTPKRKLIRQGGRIRFESHSRESEAYRTIRTGLLYGLSDDNKAKTLLVTSPGALEGKTTLVSNLGAAMAHAGQKTLIIDADLRKPMQQRIFAMKETGKGLTDLLAREAGLDEVIRSTDIDGLHVLASGENAANPSELLNGREFARVLDELKGQYDRILVDSSPVGIVSDAQILANLCDLTLLVLRAKRSSRVITQRARDALMTVGASLAGAVVNDVAKRDHRYSHYSGYGPYYGGQSKRKESAVAPRQLSAEGAGSEEKKPPLEAAVDRMLGTDEKPALREPKQET